MRFYFTEFTPNGGMATIKVALSPVSHTTPCRSDEVAGNAREHFGALRQIHNLTIREVYPVPGDSSRLRLLIANLGKADAGKHDLRITYVRCGKKRTITTAVPPLKKDEQYISNVNCAT